MSRTDQDPRYRVNIRPGLRVMIQEDRGSELVPCYVKDIITGDPKHESGIKVLCENGKTGRVRYVGTESAYKTSLELVTILEKRLRGLIVDILSKHDPNWWDNNVPTPVRENVKEKQEKAKKQSPELGIPEYARIEETDFSHLSQIIGYRKNWTMFFEPVFGDKRETLRKLDEVRAYRNLPAHGKDPTEEIENKIRLYFDDLVRLVESHYRLQ